MKQSDMQKRIMVVILAGVSSAAGLSLSSPDFKAGETLSARQMYSSYGCTRANFSPALKWSGAPAGTRSFALTVFDPDARQGTGPGGKGWWHWLVYNLPASANSLKTGAGDPQKKLLPAGAIQGKTNFDPYGYGGPCPPIGDQPHRYIFTLYALNVGKLKVAPAARPAELDAVIRRHAIAKAVLMGKYGR